MQLVRIVAVRRNGTWLVTALRSDGRTFAGGGPVLADIAAVLGMR